MNNIKVRHEILKHFVYNMNLILDYTNIMYLIDSVKIAELTEFKELITEAEEKRYPDTVLLQTLLSAVVEAEKCASVAHQLVTKKIRTR